MLGAQVKETVRVTRHKERDERGRGARGERHNRFPQLRDLTEPVLGALRQDLNDRDDGSAESRVACWDFVETHFYRLTRHYG